MQILTPEETRAHSIFTLLGKEGAGPVRWLMLAALAFVAWLGGVGFLGQFRPTQVSRLVASFAPLDQVYFASFTIAAAIALVAILAKRWALSWAAATVAAYLGGFFLSGLFFRFLPPGVVVPFTGLDDAWAFALSRLWFAGPIVVVLGLLWLAIRKRVGGEELGLWFGNWLVASRDVSVKEKPASWLAKLFGGYLIFVVVFAILVQLPVGFAPMLSGALWPLLPAILIAAGVNAVAEEAVYRGFIQPAFIRYGGAGAGLWVQGLFFGIIHWGLSVGVLAALPTSLLIGVGSVDTRACLDDRSAFHDRCRNHGRLLRAALRPQFACGLTARRRGVISRAPNFWGWKAVKCMRGDMSKVIVERARVGAGWLRKGRPLRDDDLALSEADLKTHARRRGSTKSLNENLSPLRRYLEAQVGRPWNKVWSEICKCLKPSNTVQQHVRDHIPDFVAIKTRLKDGEIWIHGRWDLTPLKDSHVRLYVDPKSGLLRRNKHWRSWQSKRAARREAEAKARAARMRVISDDVQLHLLGDCWWEVKLAAVPTTLVPNTSWYGPQKLRAELPVDDVLLRALADHHARNAIYGRSGVYAASKRQLSKKEIRALKLR